MNTPILETLLPLVQEYARKKARMWIQGEEELSKPDDDLTTFLSTHGVDWDLLPVKEQDEIRDQYILAVQVALQPVGSDSCPATASLAGPGVVVQSEVVKAAAEALERLLFAKDNADETGYVTDVGFLDLDALDEFSRYALSQLRSSLGEPDLGGPEAVRPPVSGLAASGADVPAVKNSYFNIIPFTPAGWEALETAYERAAGCPTKEESEKWESLAVAYGGCLLTLAKFGASRLNPPKAIPTPDHSALLIEARDALEAVHDLHGQLYSSERFVNKWGAARTKCYATLSKLQSIKL